MSPVLRPGLKSGIAVESSCFPLVPFGNRVSGNRFRSPAGEHQLQPNVEWDRHYLHGDGWLNRWRCVAHSPTQLRLEYIHRQGVYLYTAQQVFTLSASGVEVELIVTNEGIRSRLAWAGIPISRCRREPVYRRMPTATGLRKNTG